MNDFVVKPKQCPPSSTGSISNDLCLPQQQTLLMITGGLLFLWTALLWCFGSLCTDNAVVYPSIIIPSLNHLMSPLFFQAASGEEMSRCAAYTIHLIQRVGQMNVAHSFFSLRVAGKQIDIYYGAQYMGSCRAPT